MAANDEFPRGWTITSNTQVGTAACTCVLPAVPGVIHVLDGFSVKLVNSGGAAESTSTVVTTSDGVLSSYQLPALLAVSGVQQTVDSADASDLNLSGGPGASMTVSFAPAFSNSAILVIFGHDI